MNTRSEMHPAATRASAWKLRREHLLARTYAAKQREQAALGRSEAAVVREVAAQIRSNAAIVRDDGARTRDDAARVRDGAARVRDQAAIARDLSTKTREESVRRRLLGNLDAKAWSEIFELDRIASDHAHEATRRDREAVDLDRAAADKDRDAAEHDRSAASKDRDAAEKDREASEKDRIASEADRGAAESDRVQSEIELSVAETHLDKRTRVEHLGRLAAGIAHEINNPLAALSATLATMQLELDEDSVTAASMGPLVADARMATERVCAVINDMREWLNEGQQGPARQCIDVQQWIDDAVRLTRTKFGPQTHVVIEVKQTEPLWGVRSRLSQVLSNLLLNAARATRSLLAANEVRISVQGAGSLLHLDVKDAGVGIAPDVLPHIFDPFFTTHEGTGGMGLGLAMSERIVHEHAGTLTVETTVGHGSTFRLTLPCGEKLPLQQVTRESRARVLVVDDDLAFSRSLSRLLATRCDVSTAADGAEGLALLLAPGSSWDVVLCDLMMPTMNGLELYRELALKAPTLTAKVIFVTGGATTPETATFLATLPNEKLEKPFDADRLFALIDARFQDNSAVKA